MMISEDTKTSALKHAIDLAKQGHTKHALKLFQQLYLKDTSSYQVIYNMGVCYVLLKEYESGLACLKRILAAFPNYADAHYNAGICYTGLKKPALGVACFEKAQELNFDLKGELYKHWADAYRSLGNFEEAERLLLEAYSIQPDANILLALTIIKEYSADEHGILPKIESMLAQPSLLPKDALALHFAYARLADQLGLYDHAFSHLVQANDGVMTIIEPQIEGFVKRCDSVMSVFNRGFVDAYSTYGENNVTPIFVVGMPRSGTTLTERIIASHSQVFGAGECEFVEDQINCFIQNRSDQAMPKRVLDATAFYMSAMKELNSNHLPMTVDKMPANYMYIGLIKTMFPKAIIIHCRRHPLDVCLSIYFQNFHERRSYYSDFSHMAKMYQYYIRMMRYWHEQFPEQIYENYYEHLIVDQEYYSRKLIDHCGLKWEDKCLEYYQHKASVHTASSWQVRQKIYDKSMFRYQHYAKHLVQVRKWLEDEINQYENDLDINAAKG